MDIEFHFYVTYILAKAAGFSEDDSYIIGYSSQYVDDNDTRYSINKGKEDEYKNYISQTIDILKPRKKLMRIYPCFHFVPGDYSCECTRRKDGKLSILNTTPNSLNGNILIEEALSTGNPYRIGIASHSFADTWAHQNFVGYFDSFNGVGGVLETITPNIGHADVQRQPDIPSLYWKDPRLITENMEINNKRRFIEAAENIFRKYTKHLKVTDNDQVDNRWKELKVQIEEAFGDEFSGKDRTRKERIVRCRKLLKKWTGNSRDYDKDHWFDEAIETKTRGLPDRPNIPLIGKIEIFPDKYLKKKEFEDSHWYKFQEAVKEHQEFAEDLYGDIFRQMEVEEY